MNKKEVEWLYQQLPELVAKGVIPAESVELLKNHYGPVEENTGNRTFLVVFGVIGALLVGLGIILILAHNWAQLTKINRLAIAVGLLLAAQIGAGTVLWFKRDSLVWREAAATLLMLMVGAAMALVGQTYHLVEDTDAFLLTWMVLSLPLMYLMNSAGVAVMYVIGVTFWTGGHSGISKQLIWVLLGLAQPYYWSLLKNSRNANTTVVLSWVITICFYFCFAAAFSNYLDQLGLLIYSALFTLAYLVGLLWFTRPGESWRMPFKAVGLVGSIGLTFVLTFNDIWEHVVSNWQSVPLLSYVLACGLLGMVIGGNIMAAKRKILEAKWLSLIPCVIGVAYLVQFYDGSGIGATLILNGYMLWVSICIISAGVRERSLGIVNLGMVVMAALIVARFFDIDLSFVVRGVVFVLIGIGFLVANVVLVRRKAGWQNEK
ncbi:DUF2157 domain-containing protein [Sporomusa malonica]|uniref:Predicted membrane protein n=1 Tax=Sporomusa malonica TaxID=112901 RepID=A0A1W2BUB7_9FIRM|nr:DUF2157 domain-containing protein [Sporomusa malonica]SMC76580.1 Predicted membrane protein [Sporomusa malonica]